jgi:hypothetical protein
VILSGPYLYFYDNHSALIPIQTLYIKNSVIQPLPDAFSITNRYNYTSLASESAREMTTWISVLNKAIEEFTTEKQFLNRREK